TDGRCDVSSEECRRRQNRSESRLYELFVGSDARKHRRQLFANQESGDHGCCCKTSNPSPVSFFTPQKDDAREKQGQCDGLLLCPPREPKKHAGQYKVNDARGAPRRLEALEKDQHR